MGLGFLFTFLGSRRNAGAETREPRSGMEIGRHGSSEEIARILHDYKGYADPGQPAGLIRMIGVGTMQALRDGRPENAQVFFSTPVRGHTRGGLLCHATDDDTLLHHVETALARTSGNVRAAILSEALGAAMLEKNEDKVALFRRLGAAPPREPAVRPFF